MSIVLGYDESPGARQALTVAIDVAQRYGTTLVLVYGVAPPGGAGEESSSHRAALEESARAAVDDAVRAAEQAGLEALVEVRPAKPVDALLQAAEQHDATVIVVGTWGESPIRGAILGATPHKLLHLSRWPVLCVPGDT